MIRKTYPLIHPEVVYGLDARCIFAPIVEVAGTVDPFLTQTVEELTAERDAKNVDILFGYTSAVSECLLHRNATVLKSTIYISQEMLSLMAPKLLNETLLQMIDENFEIPLPWISFPYGYETNVMRTRFFRRDYI